MCAKAHARLLLAAADAGRWDSAVRGLLCDDEGYASAGAARLAGVLIHFGLSARAVATAVASITGQAGVGAFVFERVVLYSNGALRTSAGSSAPMFPVALSASVISALDAGVGTLRSIAKALVDEAGLANFCPPSTSPGGACVDAALACANCEGLRPMLGAIRQLRLVLASAEFQAAYAATSGGSPLAVWGQLALASASAFEASASLRELRSLLDVDAAAGEGSGDADRAAELRALVDSCAAAGARCWWWWWWGWWGGGNHTRW